MPDIHFQCPRCAQSVSAPEEAALQSAPCPTCREIITIPASPPPAAPPKPQPHSARSFGEGREVAITATPQPNLFPDTDLAFLISVLGTINLVAALVVGLILGLSYSTAVGWLVFIGGIISGLTLLGFARIITNSSLSVRYLRDVRDFLRKNTDRGDKT